MTSARFRPAPATVLSVLFVFSPFVLVLVVIAVLGVVLLGAIVVAAFQAGFAEGCAALSALIGIPSIGLLWLSTAMRLFGFGRRAPTPTPTRRSDLHPTVAERYAAGDFEHRDNEVEQREWEAFRREKGW